MGQCSQLNAVYNVEQAGAVAAVYTDAKIPPLSWDVWTPDLQVINPSIPSVGLSNADTQLLLNAGAQLALSADPARATGVDSAGHVYMYASIPIAGASTASHWDPIVRPDLLMEPAESVNTSHDITMERAALRDIGWPSLCGNGATDPGEACDNGAANSDTAPNACRTTCVKAACGDGVLDSGEQCDTGLANSDTRSDACRSSCKPAKCGDGVIDTGLGEQCDGINPSLCADCKVVMQNTAGASGVGGGAGASGVGGNAGTSNAGTSNAGTGNAAGSPPAPAASPAKKSGCGCRVVGRAEGDALWLAFALGGAILQRRRRRSA
jgi:hypothetical protein